MALTGPDLGARMVKFAKTIERGSAATVKASAEVAKAEQLRRMRTDSGGDLRLSGVNKARGRAGNTRIGVSYRLNRDGLTASATVKATGPLQIINNNTKARRIASAYAGGSRAARSVAVGPILPRADQGGRRAVLNTPFGFRRSVRHPGTTGKQTWQVGRRAAEPKIRTEMGKRTSKTIIEGMRP